MPYRSYPKNIMSDSLAVADETLAVIFDMDGVLVNTYRAHFRSWLEMAEAEGFSFTEGEFAATFGRTSREIIAHFWGEGRLDDAQIAALDDRKEAAFRRMIETDFPAMPGVGELLRSLHNAGFRLAVGRPARRRTSAWSWIASEHRVCSMRSSQERT